MQASRVLLVAPTPQLSATLRAWLTDAGCAVMVATSFSSAKAQIKQGLSILISEVRLGDYNGLHLAIRAKSSDIPSIVLGAADAVLQRDAEALGVMYLTYGSSHAELMEVVERIARPAGGATPIDYASNISFASWDELVLAARPSEESFLESPRRILPS